MEGEVIPRVTPTVRLITSGSTFTFWRFMIEVPLSSHEMKINYTINNGIELNFFVPGRNQNMRWAAYSASIGGPPGDVISLTHAMSFPVQWL